MDGTGELVTEDGVSVRFGASACKDFQPRIGMEVWLIAFGPHPLGKGYKATVVNVSGKAEKTRFAEAEEANRLKGMREQREAQLLKRHGLEAATWHYWKQLVELSPEHRRAIAADLVTLKRESHLFDRLFEELVTVDPESLHPFLAELDWRAEPESLAWTRAPYENVKFAGAVLAKSAAIQLREQVPIGTVAPANEMARRVRAPANEVGAAVFALVRSGCREAIADLAQWIAESRTSPDQLNDLLVVAGWQTHNGALRQLWGHRKAFHVRREANGKGRLFEPSTTKCPACEAPLLGLLRDTSEELLPFPLFTCANCAVLDIQPYYVAVSSSGEPEPLLREELDDDYEPVIKRDGLPASIAVVFVQAPCAVPDDIDEFEQLTRIGGAPSWVQSPQTAGACPKCSVPMEFLAQFPDPPGDPWSDTRMLYVFGCTSCHLTASFVQNA
jgi:hypothetical protein